MPSQSKSLNTKRVSLTIPDHVLLKIDRVATLMSLSRSSLVSNALDGSMDSMLTVLESILSSDPELSGGTSTRRSTVSSRVLIQKEINSIQSSLSNFSGELWNGADDNEH